MPLAIDAPPNATSVTSISSPGSKRVAVPAGMSRRMPNASRPIEAQGRLTSKKCA